MSESETHSLSERGIAWAIHLYTASGVLWGLLALMAIFERRLVDAYTWMLVAAVVDASDGPLARRYRVRDVVPSIDGALLDNIVDYLNWSLVPIVLLWHMDWLVAPGWAFCGLALLCSVFAFVNTGAKETELGFFRGFPSYWNVVAFFIDLLHRHCGPELGQTPHIIATTGLCVLSLLSVLPVYFVYPTRIDRYRWFFIGGGIIWVFQAVAMVFTYPDIPAWLFWSSLIYPVGYIGLSLVWNPGVYRRLAKDEETLEPNP